MKQEVIISNPEKLKVLVNKFKKEGKEKIHIVSYFDKTLTKFLVDNKKSSTSWSQFRNLGYFGEEYIKESTEMFDYYYPIEISSTVSPSEKLEKMKEWWKKHLDLLIKNKVSKSVLREVVKKGKIELREKTNEFFDLLVKNKIPLIIISSGLGDMIIEILDERNLNTENVFVLSNFFKFNEEGLAIDFKDEVVITSLNKKEVSLKNLSIYNELETKKNVILLGDAIEDRDMSENENLIRIGFLNEKIEENLEQYKKNFDVVLTGDHDFSFVNKLIGELV
jgi:cytosolic 5'-nucleotidase 3